MLPFKVDGGSTFQDYRMGKVQSLSRVLELRIEEFLELNTGRSRSLFYKFLPQGYLMTTLDCVPRERMDPVVFAKVFLGMIITLYDDLADRPDLRNPHLLSVLYQINLGQSFSLPSDLILTAQERKTYELAASLFAGLVRALEGFPHYEVLKDALKFDFEMFYCCNRYSELIFKVPGVGNLSEIKTLGHYNMGIVAAGTIDLMASVTLNLQDLGSCREIFLLGQRLGRISNLIFTHKRELGEGDVTHEFLYSAENHSQALLKEFDATVELILGCPSESFGTVAYAQGLRRLHYLHERFEGQI